MRTAWLLVLAAGCSFEPGMFGPRDGGPTGDGPEAGDAGDGSMMTTGDAATNCWNVQGVMVNVCLTSALSGTTDITSDGELDTDTDSDDCADLEPGSSNVCVVAASTFRIGPDTTVGVNGERPLVVIANTVTIEGTLDAASHRGVQRGPNANAAGCNAGTAATGVGGGQGGSLGGAGGKGGDEFGTTNGGIAGAPLTVTTLRGGCPGGIGGNGNNGSNGGGAVMLIANAIHVGNAGAINASGASGQGGDAGREGGSGAGSGGMIVLVSPSIVLGTSAAIFANGGHGGGGSDNTTGGFPGTDSTGPSSGGSGGIGTGGAGDGGPGYPASARDGEDGTGNDGGGGGGGGAGILRVYGTTLSGPRISPQPS